MKPSLGRHLVAPFALVALAALARCTPEPVALLPATPAPPPSAAPAVPAEAPPLGRLPSDTRPTGYTVSVEVDPAQVTFHGSVRITAELDRARDVLWLHGRDFTVAQASITPAGGAPVAARWEQVSPGGVAALRPATPVGPGAVEIAVDYSGPIGSHEQGLYRVERGGKWYAFTQFESHFARRMFPCFDEPAFKTPFTLTVDVPAGETAVSNTAAESVTEIGGRRRFQFARTARLPTYLVAAAVGPFDVVNGIAIPSAVAAGVSIPLRGVAVQGRGAELAYALGRTGAIVNALERYFGIAYPYPKLDLIAVPGKGGAMENAGAITFGEGLLLLDEKTAGNDQRYAFEAVTAHELAHQWFGDLVTMPWWDDLWLNEGFATWMTPHALAVVAPELHAEIRAVQSTQRAMGSDSLVNARKIRQEIESDHDIENAFDGITYEKGAAVLAMFEGWMGEPVFQKGIRAYLAAHAHGTGSAGDLLASLSTAAGRDVAAPFRTFLDQPGLPFVEATLSCEGKPKLRLRQSRYLPLGSSGDENRAWQVPVCARYADGRETRRACTLLAGREGELPLEAATCPAWVMPNADADGYYRWSLGAAEGRALAKEGYKHLSPRERMSVADSVRAAFARGKLPGGEAIVALTPFAADPSPNVATAPMELLRTSARWLEKDPLLAAVRGYGRALYAPVVRDLGWAPKKGAAEDRNRALLRRSVIGFMAYDARDPEVRREAAARGRAYVGYGKDGVIHPEAVGADLAGTALSVAVEDGDAAFFDALVTLLGKEQRDPERRRILGALGSATRPELAARARDLCLDPRVHDNEATAPLQVQLEQPETRDAAWEWFKGHLDALVGRLNPRHASTIVWTGAVYCDRAHADELSALFTPRLASLDGLPRNLAGALEQIGLCAARREAQEASVRAFFANKPRR